MFDRAKTSLHEIRYPAKMFNGVVVNASVMLGLHLFFIAIIVSMFVNGTEERVWREHQSQAARFAAQYASSVISQMEDTLQMAAAVPPDSLAAEPEHLQMLIDLQPAIAELVAINSQGGVIAFTSVDEPRLAYQPLIPQTHWFIAARDGEKYISPVNHDSKSRPYLVLAIPTQYGGVIAARLQLEGLDQALRDLRTGKRGEILFIDSRGEVVMSTIDPASLGDPGEMNASFDLAAVSGAAGQEWQSRYQDLKGVRVVGATAGVPGTPWTAVAEIPISEAFAGTITASIFLYGSIVLLILASFFIGARMVRRMFFDPVYEILTGVEHIAGGELGYRIAVAGQNELAKLAAAINQMAARLSERDDELVRKSKALSAQVAEREQAEQAMQRAYQRLERLNQQLARLSEIGNHFHQNLELASLLQAITQGVQESLGFKTVVLNLVDPTVGEIRMAAHAGLAGVNVEGIADGVVRMRWPDFSPVLDEKYRHGRCYFIPAGSVDWATLQTLETGAGQPDLAPGSEPGPWNPLDALIVMVEMRSQVAGMISVDQPVDGMRPGLGTFQVLEVFANLAATAIENAYLYERLQEELKSRQQTAEELASLNEKLEERVTERTAELSREVTERKRMEEEVRESERRYRTLVENIQYTISEIDQWSSILYTSPNIKKILGYEVEERVGRPAFENVHPDDIEDVLRTIQVGRETGSGTMRYRHLHKNGEWRWLETTGQTFESADGLRGALVTRDVTEQVRAEEALRRSEAELRALLMGMTDIVIVYDREGRYLKVAPTHTNLLYRPPDEMTGQLVHDVLPAEQAVLLLEKIQTALKTQEPVTVDYNLVIGGQEVWFAGILSPMGPEQVILVARDITERKAAEAQLVHRALHDELTGLPNRALFLDRLGVVLERARRRPAYLGAVLFLDLDRFKTVNDSLGHVYGDKLLVSISRRLAGCLRPADTVARFGGDEFAILLEDIASVTDAIHVAERVQQQLAVPFDLTGHEIFTSASIGIALTSSGYQRPEDVLRDADVAMYRAKANGKARHELFDTKMHAQSVILLQTEANLRRGIERKEFRLRYQPVVSLNSRELCGVEALLRWQHPTRGLLAPADFLSIAEETGLIVPIGEWVLRTACLQMARWHADGFAWMKLAVNISPRQFQDPHLIEIVQRSLDETHLDPACLELEITEQTAMSSLDNTTRILHLLSRMGVRISIDDFGNGYSSLSYLKRFPVDLLKIDRSFISDSAEDPSSRAIVTAMIAMAHLLELKVVAEGVETEAQCEFLRGQSCDLLQGYLTGRPQAAREVTRLLHAPKAKPASVLDETESQGQPGKGRNHK